jgi:hypothetical protein
MPIKKQHDRLPPENMTLLGAHYCNARMLAELDTDWRRALVLPHLRFGRLILLPR